MNTRCGAGGVRRGRIHLPGWCGVFLRQGWTALPPVHRHPTARVPITPPFSSCGFPIRFAGMANGFSMCLRMAAPIFLGLVDAEGRNWPVRWWCRFLHAASLASGWSADCLGGMEPSQHAVGMEAASSWVAWRVMFPAWWENRPLPGGMTAGFPAAVLTGWTLVELDRGKMGSGKTWFCWTCKLVTGVLIHGDGFHLALPAWVQGGRSYGWDHRSSRVYSIGNARGQAGVVAGGPGGRRPAVIPHLIPG